MAAMDNDGYFNQLSYSILPALDHGSFSIDNSSGLVRTAVELDRERQEKLILIVEAKDSKLLFVWELTALNVMFKFAFNLQTVFSSENHKSL